MGCYDIRGSVLLLLLGFSSGTFLQASVVVLAQTPRYPTFESVGFSFIERSPGLGLGQWSVGACAWPYGGVCSTGVGFSEGLGEAGPDVLW